MLNCPRGAQTATALPSLNISQSIASLYLREMGKADCQQVLTRGTGCRRHCHAVKEFYGSGFTEPLRTAPMLTEVQCWLLHLTRDSLCQSCLEQFLSCTKKDAGKVTNLLMLPNHSAPWRKADWDIRKSQLSIQKLVHPQCQEMGTVFR